MHGKKISIIGGKLVDNRRSNRHSVCIIGTYSNHRLHQTVHRGPVSSVWLAEAVLPIKWKGPPPKSCSWSPLFPNSKQFLQPSFTWPYPYIGHWALAISHGPTTTFVHIRHGSWIHKLDQPRFGNRGCDRAGAALLSNLPTNTLSSQHPFVWTHLFLVRNLAS